MAKQSIPVTDRVERAIVVLRGQRVMLDRDLAALYGVELRALVQAVRRNTDRFPEDFVFQLTREEQQALRSQSVILDVEVHGNAPDLRSRGGRGSHRKYLPYAFTEQGVAMLSSVLRSSRAVAVNVEIMRAFVRLRQMLAENAELAKQLRALEKKYDAQFRVVFDAIRELMTPPTRPRGPIGFEEE